MVPPCLRRTFVMLSGMDAATLSGRLSASPLPTAARERKSLRAALRVMRIDPCKVGSCNCYDKQVLDHLDTWTTDHLFLAIVTTACPLLPTTANQISIPAPPARARFPGRQA